MNHHIIFEGPELAGKSWVMQQIYNFLEPKYNKSKNRLDGCFWLPSDIGVFGSKHGKPIIKNYLEILQELEEYNCIMEKFHISDIIYNRMYNHIEIDYKREEEILKKLNCKIVLLTYPEDKSVLESRIRGRLNIYPHYKNILQPVDWYFRQRREYLAEIKKTKLPYIAIEKSNLPDDGIAIEILRWLSEA